jgi:hypothetical protein
MMLETILVVDDDKMVLKLVVAILERANFRVPSADGGANAIKLAEETEGPIHLLLSEVDLPQMPGPCRRADTAYGQSWKLVRFLPSCGCPALIMD